MTNTQRKARKSVGDDTYGGRIVLSQKQTASSGYKAHPAATESGLRISFNLRTGAGKRMTAAVSLGSQVIIGQACSTQGLSNAWCPKAVTPKAPRLSNHFLQDRNKKENLLFVGQVGSRVVRRSGPTAYTHSKSSEDVLYTGVWQTNPGPLPTADESEGGCLNLRTGRNSMNHRIGMRSSLRALTRLEYSGTGSALEGRESAGAHVSHLLSVLQCAPELSLSALHIRTTCAMYVGSTPLGSIGGSMYESATHGMLRTVVSECPMLNIMALDRCIEAPTNLPSPAQQTNLIMARTQRLCLDKATINSGAIEIRPMPRGSVSATYIHWQA
jgi:hypothetical protein